MVKRHTKPHAQNPEGGIIEKEGTIHISNVMPVDPRLGQGDARQGQASMTRRATAQGKSGTAIEAPK